MFCVYVCACVCMCVCVCVCVLVCVCVCVCVYITNTNIANTLSIKNTTRHHGSEPAPLIYCLRNCLKK